MCPLLSPAKAVSMTSKPHEMKSWAIPVLIAGGLGLAIFYVYQKDKANAANNTSSIVQGTGTLSVLPNTATTATPVADTTWNPAYRISNQQSAASQAMS
jgi:hypothetical protein